jgi:hypothetical protein
MTNNFRARLRGATTSLQGRIAPAIAVAVCAVGLLLLFGALSKETPKPNKVAPPPIETSVKIPPTVPRESVTQKADPGPIAVAKPAVIDPVAKRVYADYPELDPQSPSFRELDDWGKVTRLREFSYRHTAFAAAPNQVAYLAGADMLDQVRKGTATLGDAYEFFDRAQGGVQCREAAELLQRLYAWAGFEAYCLEIGAQPPAPKGHTFTHVLNVVRIKVADSAGKSRAIISIQDPSLNLSYGDSQGRPIDYFDLLEVLAGRHAEQIRFIEEAPAASRRGEPVTVAFNADLERSCPTDFAGSWNLGVSPVWSAAASGHWIVRGPRTIWDFERVGDGTWKTELFLAGLPPESIYMHCFPIEFKGSSAGPDLLKQARQKLSLSADLSKQPARLTSRD